MIGNSGNITGEGMEYAIPRIMPKYTRFGNGRLSKLPLVNIYGNTYTSYMNGDQANTVIKTNRKRKGGVRTFFGRLRSRIFQIPSHLIVKSSKEELPEPYFRKEMVIGQFFVCHSMNFRLLPYGIIPRPRAAAKMAASALPTTF